MVPNTGQARLSIETPQLSVGAKSTLAALSLLSCAMAIFLPSSPQILLAMILLIVLLSVMKAGFSQYILLVTIIPPALQIKTEQIGLIGLIAVIGFALFQAFAEIAIGKGHFVRHRLIDFLIAINIYFSLNTFISSLYNSSLNQTAFMEIMRFLLYAAIIGMAYYFTTDIKAVYKIIWTAMAGSVLLALIGYKLILAAGSTTFDLYGAAFLHAASLGTANANTIATIIANPMPVLIAYLIYGEKRSYKFILSILFGLLFLVWMIWNSRASYIYLFTAILALVAFHKNRLRYLLIISAITILVIVLALTEAVPILTDFLRLGMGLSHREDLWLAGLRMIAESPLLGKGPSYFDQSKYYYMDPGHGRLVAGPWTGISPHNVLIMRGVDMGIPAIFAQLLYWIFPLVFLARHAKNIKNTNYYYLYLAAMAVWIGIIGRSQFDTGANIFSMLMLAASVRLLEFARNNGQANVRNL